MFKKKIIFLFTLVFLLTSCADSWDSVKRGLTGAKKKSTDEFLVKKKDPLVLPPDYDSLPTPDDRVTAQKDIASFEEKLTTKSLTESDLSTNDSAEKSIIEQIRNQ